MQKSRQSFTERTTYWLKVVSLGMVLGLGLQFAQAWVAPTGPPPSGNVAGPLTTGSSQTKAGALTTGGLAAPSFVDTDNAARYVNPSGTSVLWGLSIASLPSCDLKTNASGAVYCGTDQTGGGGGDDLGSHLATQNLNMGTKQIYGLAGGNSLSWGSSAGAGNSIYSDGANGNIGIRASGAVHIQNQAGTANATLYTGYTYSSSTIDAHDYWIRAIGKWASQLGGLSTSGMYECPYLPPAGNGDHQASSSNCVGQITKQAQCHTYNCHKDPWSCDPVAHSCTPL